MGRWLIVLAVASAATLAEQRTLSVPPENGRVKVRRFSETERAMPQSADRCGHIVVVPANPEIDPGIVKRLPKASDSMPTFPALPPCKGAQPSGKQAIPSTTIDVKP